MATANNHFRRIAAAGALAVAALTGPALAALGPSTTDSATGNCLAWYGARGEGICLGYSNGTPTYIGTPQGGYLGPGYGVGIPGAGGIGVTTGPLLPGQTINVPIGGN
jgi:hypothetical protein